MKPSRFNPFKLNQSKLNMGTFQFHIAVFLFGFSGLFGNYFRLFSILNETPDIRTFAGGLIIIGTSIVASMQTRHE